MASYGKEWTNFDSESDSSDDDFTDGTVEGAAACVSASAEWGFHEESTDDDDDDDDDKASLEPDGEQLQGKKVLL